MRTNKLVGFQFAHAGGVRPLVGLPIVIFSSFNSRTRGACDKRDARDALKAAFQFAHAGGVRRRGRAASWTVRRFNSRTRGACDLPRLNELVRLAVSIRARGGRATFGLIPHPLPPARFNSRTRGACDADGRVPEADGKFQFAHAGGVRQEGLRRAGDFWKFQFAHAGGVRRRAHPVGDADCVSIRARGGRATPGPAPRTTHTSVSIRARGGRATEVSPNPALFRGVSIRARGGRATDKARIFLMFHVVSIRARGGRATTTSLSLIPVCGFQFAHAGGVRRQSENQRWHRQCFNSRTRGACDHCGQTVDPARGVSIRARGGRATPAPKTHSSRSAVSIRARGGRATLRGDGRVLGDGVSIRARGGRATMRKDYVNLCACFNSRTRGACDRRAPS